MDKYEPVLREVLARVKPRDWEYSYLSTISRIILSYVSHCLEDIGIDKFEVSVQGSYAKDTFVSGNVDIDVFFLLEPHRVDERALEQHVVPKLKQCLESQGLSTTLEYAAHPYVTVYMGGIEVNVVPAFKVKSPTEIVSAVDRTPFHTQYVRSKLSDRMRDEVRLLKAFMKGIGVYGAEIKVQGFSGYLAELLVINYGSFINVLREACKWRPYRTCIDIEGYYSSPKECLKRFPKSVLIVVDPVDPNRNAAAAVGIKAFSLFRICASLFLSNPSTRFFERYEPRVSVTDLKRSILAACSSMGRRLVLLESSVSHRSEDVVWGQLRRLERSLVNQLKSREVEVLYIDSYLDLGRGLAVTLLDIRWNESGSSLHLGPPAQSVEDSVKFILRNLDSLVGPWINPDNRLVCIKRRDLVDIVWKSARGIQLEFIKPIRVVDLCKDLGFELVEIKEFRSWLYESINRDFFKYLLGRS